MHIYHDGGYTAPTIAGVQELGACPESLMPSDEAEAVAFDPKLECGYSGLRVFDPR